ncbi:acyl-CoA dehydrogenase family protein [Naumannella halotolerans]|uniref:Alkylation response protein AidB-like acyl-CoA dehydrogenase n=1 Tax=Naumannella halotolerans TaxID=993414 RepID=A0A4R7IZC5_9ACTN|nr:acyl-CoA dehydrogenase family protein [Naumannella halotolerans]TDT30064.1 alkylation response protein AidB-like acyl-CoA dehydrogenase [Naumannella halotolerans]
MRPRVQRLLPNDDAAEMVSVVADFARAELEAAAAQGEEAAKFPEKAYLRLAELGVLGMAYPEADGGLGRPYEVYLQALEEIAAAWFSVGVGVSVHTMSAWPLAHVGTPQQRSAWLPGMLNGGGIGGYALSEPQAGSDISAITTRATKTDGGWRINGTKAWITNGGYADHYTLFARTGEAHHDLSCFLVPGDAPGLSAAAPEKKMGMTGSPTAMLHLDDVEIDHDRLIGEINGGARIALSALDSGRLGIAACATGLAQAALDHAVAHAREREQFGRPISDFQGMQFLLAEMAAAVDSSRATYLMAARKRDAGMDFTRDAAVAKLTCTDSAMKVTTDAVQVLGGYGYTRDFPVERFMREAKITQIFEGTNQIQRLVIARQLARS